MVALLLFPGASLGAPTDRGSALTAYLEVQEAAQVEPGWTGSTEECRVGSESQASLDATLTAVNAFRALAGVEPVGFEPEKNEDARAAAMVMARAGRLSHNIDSSWPCHSESAERGAAASNLGLGYPTGARAIEGYLEDDGTESLGHRRWLLNPGAVEFGSGSVGGANALYVLGSYGDGSRLQRVESDDLLAWPPPGWVPRPWIYRDWSATVGKGGRIVSLQGADVDVRLDGEPLPVLDVRQHAEGYGTGPMLSWRVDVPWRQPLADRSFEVSISGVAIGGESADLSYTVKVLDIGEGSLTEDGTPESINVVRCRHVRGRVRISRRAALRARRVSLVRRRQVRRVGGLKSRRNLRVARRELRRSVLRLRRHRRVARRVCRRS